MNRVCGKEGCKCTRGELHPGLYLAMRMGEKRKKVHVPQALEATARGWVAVYGGGFPGLFGTISQGKGKSP